MPKTQLRAALAELRAHLENPSDLDQEEIALLSGLHDQLEGVLDATSEVPREQQARVQASVGSMVERFELRHPKLTEFFGSLADMLAGMGL